MRRLTAAETPLGQQEEQEKIAQTAVDELRRKYAELTTGLDQLRNKVLASIAGELALIAFLFATGMEIPHVIFGIFFFLVGCGSIIASFILLGITLKGVDWISPGPSRAVNERDNLTALTKVCDDYSNAIELDTPILAKRSSMFDTALTLLLIGVTILLVIKYGQGEIQWQHIVKN